MSQQQPVQRGISSLVAVLTLIMMAIGLAGTAVATPKKPVPSANTHQHDPRDDSGEAGVCATCSPPLVYHDGAVTGTPATTGEMTLTPVYWQPAGVAAYNFNSADPTYMSIINKFVTDVAADSGKTTNVFANNAQYTQTVNGVTTPIKYLIHAGTPLIDANAFPSSGQCSLQADGYEPGKNYTSCLTAPQIQAELQKYLGAKALPEDVGHQYAIFFPPGVQTFESGSYSGVGYTGIHQSFTVNPGKGVIYYYDEPFQDGFYTGGAPSGDGVADGEVDVLSHEVNESITDPASRGWWDAEGNEIGDECADAYGPPLGSVAVNGFVEPYNQVINGDKYYIQREFSNTAYAARGVGNGCVQTPYTAAAVMLKPQLRAPATGREFSAPVSTVSLDASPSTLPADGTSTSTITVTAADAQGDPVAGATMHMFVEGDYDTMGAGGKTVGGGSGTATNCGTLSGDTTDGHNGVTDADGEVRLTYTASADDAECYVLASNIDSGSTNQTVIYQGNDRVDAPTVTQTVPAVLTAGGATTTFTVAATNPSPRDIDDARFSLRITGDDTSLTGVDAGQVSLSYKDDATKGAFVAVPLTGSTSSDGQIDGFVLPDRAQRLAAGDTRKATFQMSLAGGTVDSATTGRALHLETDLDTFNPADGSQSNLDYTGTDSTVAADPGDAITYTGKVSVTTTATATRTGTATLVANTCAFGSDGAKCTLTGTETLTATGGTLTGFVSTNNAKGAGDRTFMFTDTFTTATTGTTTTGTGSGTGQMVNFDDGGTSDHTLSDSFVETPTKAAKVLAITGTLAIAATDQ